MARLESEAKGGFYPTPPKEMAFIMKRLTGVDGITLLDPCCGEGKALRQLQDYLFLEKGIHSVSYGIELEKTRAETAINYVDHVINCGYEESRMTHHAFSFMYLNPPFSEFRGERLEKIFLRDLTKPNTYLTEGAVVILNMPQHVLYHVAGLVAQRMENVRIYRFTDDNFFNYRQCIVYGTIRKNGGSRNVSIQNKLEQYAYLPIDMIPTLDVEDDVVYHIPKATKEVSIFETNFVDVDDILKSLSNCQVLAKTKEMTAVPKNEVGGGKNPAMPLKLTHMATAIASGALPESMGDHLLVGVTKIRKTENTEVDEDGKVMEIETYQSQSLIRVFSEKGIFNLS